MRKLILFSLMTIFFSCSSDSNDEPSSLNNQITPPSWIQGTWLQTMSTNPLITQPIFRFKSNDFCVLPSNLEICNAESIKQALQAGAKTSIQQTITDSEYTLTMTIQGQTTTYSFIRKSTTKIDYVNPTNGLPNLSLTK